MNVFYREIIPLDNIELLSFSDSDNILPLPYFNCEKENENAKFIKKKFNPGDIYAFNIYKLKSGQCQKITLEMVEEMIKNYGTFYDPELFDKIYNIKKNVSFPLKITYETN